MKMLTGDLSARNRRHCRHNRKRPALGDDPRCSHRGDPAGRRRLGSTSRTRTRDPATKNRGRIPSIKGLSTPLPAGAKRARTQQRSLPCEVQTPADGCGRRSSPGSCESTPLVYPLSPCCRNLKGVQFTPSLLFATPRRARFNHFRCSARWDEMRCGLNVSKDRSSLTSSLFVGPHRLLLLPPP